MSLKAKIEAVIYAADEPVTLAQLAAIFADEALQAALEFSSAANLPLDDAAPASAVPFAGVQEAVEDETSQPQTESTATSAEQPALPMEDADAKKKARLRDREARLAIQRIIEELIAEYAGSERGMEIREIAGGYRIATKAEYHDAVRSFVKSLKPQMKLSLQALETLAVIAYKQPITSPEISEIRGVDTSGVLGSLMARKLIATAGRKQVIGRPILYKTTKEFLLRFGLKDVGELPSIEEFEKMAADMVEPEQEEAVSSQALQGTAPVEAGNETVPVTEEISAVESVIPEEENGATS
ncbi:MAG: SMC-Scp complex subunit ScpB [Acidobacteriaceae bacterium]